MLVHQIVVLGYKQVSVLHNVDMLLISRTGVAEKLHLKNKRLFFTTSHVPILLGVLIGL